MEALRKILAAMMLFAALVGTASARLITSFEDGLTGMTIDPGTLPSRVAVQTSFISNSETISPTDGGHLLKMTAGSTPIAPGSTYLASIVTFIDLIHVNAGEYLLIDMNLAGRQSRPFDDWMGIATDGVAYRAMGTIDFPTSMSSGQKTFAVKFRDSGWFELALLCVNDTFNGASSFCGFDFIRTADSLPSAEHLAIFPLIEPIEPLHVGNPDPPVINPPPPPNGVPEPASFVLAGLGLIGAIGFTRRRRNLAG